MAVYVDKLTNYGVEDAPRCFRKKPSCHMYADTLKELHAVARQIGIKREWFQKHPFLPHYDLTAGKREQAVKAGAIEHDRKDLVRFMDAYRQEKLFV